MLPQPSRDVLRRLGLSQHGVAEPGGVEITGDAEQRLGRAVVAFGDHRGLAVGADDPSRQCPGPGAHVVLGVAVAVAEREQLHEFAGQVFVGGLGGIGLPVQPAQHRGVGEHRVRQGAEIAQRKGAQLLILRGHLRRGPDLLCGRGKVVVPQQGQLFVDRLPDGDHAPQPPARQHALLLGQLAAELLARCLCRAFTRGARRRESGHRGGDRARVGVGVGAQHGVDVGRPVPGERSVDLRAGHPEPGPPQHAGSADPLRGLPRHASTVAEFPCDFLACLVGGRIGCAFGDSSVRAGRDPGDFSTLYAHSMRTLCRPGTTSTADVGVLPAWWIRVNRSSGARHWPAGR